MRQTSADLRRRNVFDVLRCVHAAGTSTRKDLAAELGLSVATVASIVGELQRVGLVAVTVVARRGVGRPEGRLRLAAELGTVVGVDLAETYLHVELFDAALRTTHSARTPLDPRVNDPADVVAATGEAVERALADAGVRPEQVVATGVSVPGHVEPAGGASIFAPNWAWHDVPVGALLSERLGRQVHVDNALRALTVAALCTGVAAPGADVAIVNLGTGVGAGLALGGTVLRGRTNTAGEWGHTTLVFDGRPCRCGARGCLEAYVGAPGIVATLAEADPASPLLVADDQSETVRRLALAADDGDPVALAVLATTGRRLGAGIGNLVNTVNPELVTITGWVSTALGAHLLPHVRDGVAAQALAAACTPDLVRLDELLAPQPVALGAAALALEHLVDQLHATPVPDPHHPVRTDARSTP